jgi:hypothetical protein
MPEVIYFREHPIVKREMKRRLRANYQAKSCPLIDEKITLPTCGGYEGGKCLDCEVPKYFEKAKTLLTKLTLTSSM